MKLKQRYEFESYLKRTGVFDIVQESLKQTALSRPADPIRFVSEYLKERAD